MAEVRHQTKTPGELAEEANLRAQNETNRANIDYIAMMADIDIPTEDEGNEVE